MTCLSGGEPVSVLVAGAVEIPDDEEPDAELDIDDEEELDAPLDMEEEGWPLAADSENKSAPPQAAAKQSESATGRIEFMDVGKTSGLPSGIPFFRTPSPNRGATRIAREHSEKPHAEVDDGTFSSSPTAARRFHRLQATFSHQGKPRAAWFL